jgi:regulator of sigma E protease
MGQEVLPATIGTITPNSIAEQKGLLSGDKVVSFNDEAIGSWQAFEESLKLSVGEPVTLGIQRDQAKFQVRFTLPQPEKDAFLIDVADSLLGVNLGMDVIIESVMPDSPAEKGLLQGGDKVLAVNGKPVKNVYALIDEVGSHAGDNISLQVQRNNAQLQLQVTPQANEAGRGLIGVRLTAKPWENKVMQRKGILESVAYGFSRTWEVSVMTLEMFKRMLNSSISADNIGGPIAIAQMAGNSASHGLVYFVMFLAFFSVNLAILNLLPIPVLDGGMLMFLALEQVRGKPLSAEMQMRFQMVGMLLIMSLMVFAFYNDIMRLF